MEMTYGRAFSRDEGGGDVVAAIDLRRSSEDVGVRIFVNAFSILDAIAASTDWKFAVRVSRRSVETEEQRRAAAVRSTFLEMRWFCIWERGLARSVGVSCLPPITLRKRDVTEVKAVRARLMEGAVVVLDDEGDFEERMEDISSSRSLRTVSPCAVLRDQEDWEMGSWGCSEGVLGSAVGAEVEE